MVTQELLENLKTGKLSCVEHVRTQLALIKKENPRINAFLYVAEKEALVRALELDKGSRKGKLFGLTLGVKANINVQGMPISCASRTLDAYKGTYNADVIERIIAEGGIVLGMTNMDEFACGISGETSAFGPTINPVAPKRVPGGSSSGSAAAVAVGFCDLALGSDTGGSIRNPASHCGIVGMKPSYGRVSRYGLIDLSMSLDQIGPLAPDTFGCALLFDVIAGRSENDPMTLSEPVHVQQLPKTIALSPAFEALCTDKKIYRLIKEKVLAVAKEKHLKLVELDFRYVTLAVQAYYPIVYTEFFSGTRKFDGRRYGRRIEEACNEEVLRRILGGRIISCAEHEGRYYRKALRAARAIRDEFEKAFKIVDLLAMPTTPELPHLLGKLPSPEAAYAYDAFTIPANLAGICAGVVPCGLIDKVPVGLQLYAGRDHTLLGGMGMFGQHLNNTMP
ncbi:Asp-tRNA(Asn)/Glu-tRNA(Gln) amidotransferase subunit GatA [Candidatus Woesearchaeota archaeon]|nr:Asp-tRNA(Asn)/Glu-tRNA(Gln) amidotransferase subunit GatA [Candidatus Woesearchaeota archaeon]